MSDYELYAFSPSDVGSLCPRRHQTRIVEARAMAIAMLEEVASGAQPCCSGCWREFRTKLPPVLIILVPKNLANAVMAASRVAHLPMVRAGHAVSST